MGFAKGIIREKEEKMSDSNDNMSSMILHRLAFENDVKGLHEEISCMAKEDDDATTLQKKLSYADMHGNTPLHLAVMLGHIQCVEILCQHGSLVKCKNKGGWTVLDEAISYGNRAILRNVYVTLQRQMKDTMAIRMPILLKKIAALSDFYMEIHWKFSSWLPLVSRMCPSDVCRIYKKGSCVRAEMTLIGTHNMSWQRGDVAFIFRGRDDGCHELLILDNQGHIYEEMHEKEEKASRIESDLDDLMASTITAFSIPTKNIRFDRERVGFWGFRKERWDRVGLYEARVFQVYGVTLLTHKRREHLSEMDIKKNKAILNSFKSGNEESMQYLTSDVDSDDFDTDCDDCDEDKDDKKVHRESLPPPPPTDLSFTEYCNLDPPLHVGRPMLNKLAKKSIKASVRMSDDFELPKEEILNLLEILIPSNRHFEKVLNFIEMKMPAGFPVRVDIPIFPILSAQVSFHEYQQCIVDPALMQVPADFIKQPIKFMF